MKKIIIALLVLSALAGCKKNDKETGEFPAYRITEYSSDSIVETITYAEYLKEKRKINKYNEILLKNKYTKIERQKNSLKAFIDLATEKKLQYELNYLGIQVSDEEQNNFISGDNIHSSIKKNPIFKNPRSGKFDKTRINPFINKIAQNKESAPYFMWNYQINNIKENLLEDKYESLLTSSFFITEVYVKWLKELIKKEVAIKVATLPYSNYNDSVILTNEDYKSFLNKHRSTYQIYERRYLKAAHIPIHIHKHFHEKEHKAFKRLIESKQSFQKIANMSPYIKSFSSFYYESSIPQELNTFFKNAESGDIYGPYYKNNSFRGIQFDGITNMPDKAWAQHLLLKNSNMKEAKKIKQKLKNAIAKDKPFLELAKEFSRNNQNKAEWGDTEWFRYGEMEEDFSDSTFINKPGQIVLANTRYGWHIIYIKEHGKKRKKYNFTGLYRPIEASKKDFEATLQEAKTFVNSLENPDNFERKALKNKYIIEQYESQALGIELIDFKNSEDVHKWAFNAKEGAISKPYSINNNIYIFKVESIGGPGTMPLHAAKNIIKPYVTKIKTKEYIKEKHDISSLNNYPIKHSIKKLNMNENNIIGINFNQNSLANVGSETGMIGLALSLSPGERTKLLFGKENLYSLEKTSEKNNRSNKEYFKNQHKLWKTIINNDRYRAIFNLHDRMTVNLERKQDSYFLLPKYTDTLPEDSELSAEIFRAEQAFREQKYDIALNGSKNFKGFQELTQGKLSKQRRLSALYAGLCALHLNEYEKTIKFLENIHLEDRFFSIISLGAQGDALSQQGNHQAALIKYKAAIKERENHIIVPHYLLKIAATYVFMEEYEQALKYVAMIKQDNPKSLIRREAEKLYKHLKYFTDKEEIITNLNNN